MKKTRFVCIAGSLMFLLSVPAFSQLDPTGEWAPQFHEDQPERGPGPEIGDYTGIPITEAARVRADAWDAQRWEMVEHECEPHPADYAPRGPAARDNGRDFFSRQGSVNHLAPS